MIEIKFRGKSFKGDWHYGLLSHVENKGVCGDIGWFMSNSVGAPFAYQIRPETIGQFTGLYDVKKREIYRGMKLGMQDGEDLLILGRVEYCDKPDCIYTGSYYLADEKGYASDWASEEEGKPDNWHNLEIIDGESK